MDRAAGEGVEATSCKQTIATGVVKYISNPKNETNDPAPLPEALNVVEQYLEL
jgi:hypothetical protein